MAGDIEGYRRELTEMTFWLWVWQLEMVEWEERDYWGDSESWDQE